MSASPDDIRSARLGSEEPDTRTCDHCGGSLTGHRSDANYCSDACRKAAWRDRAHEGRVASVRRLKSGQMSVVVHLPADVGLVPGQMVRVG